MNVIIVDAVSFSNYMLAFGVIGLLCSAFLCLGKMSYVWAQCVAFFGVGVYGVGLRLGWFSVPEDRLIWVLIILAFTVYVAKHAIDKAERVFCEKSKNIISESYHAARNIRQHQQQHNHHSQ